MSRPRLGPADALIVVDVQNDFCPGGALPVPEGDRVVPVLNEWIAAAREGKAKIVASRDWHPPNHASFREQGGPWPPHCVQNTPGAEFHPGLNLPKRVKIVSKGTSADHDNYSDFAETTLARDLKRAGVRRVFVGGLALDYCVRATILDGLKAGFEVHLIGDGTRAINVRPGDDKRVLRELKRAGCIVERGGDHAFARAQSGPLRAVHRPVRADDGAGVRRRRAERGGRVRADVSHAAAKPKLRRRRGAG